MPVFTLIEQNVLFERNFFFNLSFSFFPAGMNAGKKLGVEPLLKAKDVSSLNASHLGMMSYVSNFQWVKPRTRPSHTVRAHSDTHTTRVYKPVSQLN